MAFSVEDFQDLLRLLDQHPDWQAELRRRLLTDELLELPALFRQLTERVESLAEAQVRTEQRLDTLTARVEALAQAQLRTEQRLEALADRLGVFQEQTHGRLNVLESLMGQLLAQTQEIMGRVGEHSGSLLEMDYRNKYAARFARVATRLRAIDQARLGALIADAADDGTLTGAEADDLLQTDIILLGRRRGDGAEVYLAIEVSWGIGRDDIDRAERRSRILAKLGKPGVPVVAGKWMDSMLESMAGSYGVWCVLNGMTKPPEEMRTP